MIAAFEFQTFVGLYVQWISFIWFIESTSFLSQGNNTEVFLLAGKDWE